MTDENYWVCPSGDGFNVRVDFSPMLTERLIETHERLTHDIQTNQPIFFTRVGDSNGAGTPVWAFPLDGDEFIVEWRGNLVLANLHELRRTPLPHRVGE